MGVSPHRRFHEWRRRPARTWETGIFKPSFQVVLPQSKQYDEEDAGEEEANDICVSQTSEGHASTGTRITHVDFSSHPELWACHSGQIR
jgi:hypothetical protein